MATTLRSALRLAGAPLLGACAVEPYDNYGYNGNPGYYGNGNPGYYGAPGPYYQEPGYAYVEPSIGFGIGFSDRDRGDHWRDRRDWREGHEHHDRDHDRDHDHDH